MQKIKMFFKCCVALLFIGAVVARVPPMSREERLRQSLAQECEKYGHPEKTEQVQQAVVRFTDCFLGLVDLRQVQQMQVALESNSATSYIAFVQSGCAKKDEFTKCYNDMVDGVAPCLEPKKGVQTSRKVMTDFISYVCDNQAKNFVDFVNDGAMTCIKSKETALVACTNEIAGLGAYRTLPVSEACNYYDSMTDCLVSTLADCPKPSTANFVSRMFQIIEEGSKCRGSNPNEQVILNAE